MSDGNGKVPQWLADLGIKPGEYFCDSKPRAKRAMKSGCFSRAARVHLCLGLHTMGFRQELAVKMEAGKPIPLTPVDIAAETGIKKNHIRETFLELQSAGLAEIKGSTKGRVLIYSWAVPRPVEVAKMVPARGNHFGDLPHILQPIIPLLKRWRITPPPEMVTAHGYQTAVQEAVRAYKHAEMALRSALAGDPAPEEPGAGTTAQSEMVTAHGQNGYRAQERINKEERNERNSGSSSSSAVAAVYRKGKADEEEEPPPSAVSQVSSPHAGTATGVGVSSLTGLFRVAETKPPRRHCYSLLRI